MIRSTRDQLEGLGEASFYSMFPMEICVKSEYLDLVPVVQLQSGERTIFVDTGDGYIDGIFGERDITSHQARKLGPSLVMLYLFTS